MINTMVTEIGVNGIRRTNQDILDRQAIVRLRLMQTRTDYNDRDKLFEMSKTVQPWDYHDLRDLMNSDARLESDRAAARVYLAIAGEDKGPRSDDYRPTTQARTSRSATESAHR